MEICLKCLFNLKTCACALGLILRKDFYQNIESKISAKMFVSKFKIKSREFKSYFASRNSIRFPERPNWRVNQVFLKILLSILNDDDLKIFPKNQGMSLLLINFGRHRNLAMTDQTTWLKWLHFTIVLWNCMTCKFSKTRHSGQMR